MGELYMGFKPIPPQEIIIQRVMCLYDEMQGDDKSLIILIFKNKFILFLLDLTDLRQCLQFKRKFCKHSMRINR